MLKISDHGAVRQIRLARPPANAINHELTLALTAALAEAEQAADAVVVSGAPGMFSAGLDVPELLALQHDEMFRVWQDFTGLLGRIACMRVPIVFALTGHAPAGGIVLAVFGDYRIMSRGSFKTGVNEVQVGLVVPPQVYRALVRLVGPRQAERITVAGELLEAQQALDIGLVDELADDPDDVVARSIAWCERHLALPRHAMSLSREMARADVRSWFDESRDLQVGRFVDIWFETETQNTLRALVERLTSK
jgi:3,2-trans-enoyl-CoA isomerase